ncbi:Cof-type HAD-IIB family hydrolase [Robertmurraya kyonggiensis]|uniref:Cof-type HAD-IIB family hydrolase n=1 Tax=Robertmurraya kyonggiensis TaxID=1037680 RepID=A0A4U1DAE6_9BACI|nr:Cof-type HAD-IIB family hydrolase [Robertmurraya kyonggiensis]TKC19118.1 Cof-type HAD-IIB family hydrolase [Robertmurraya kyonggiensis]
MVWKKMLVLDLDGTILDSNHNISKRMVNLVQSLKKQLIYVVLATGRSVSDSYKYYLELDLDTYMLNYNGALMWNPRQNSVIESRYMWEGKKIINYLYKNQKKFEIINIILSADTKTFLLNNNNSYLTNMMVSEYLDYEYCSFTELMEINNFQRVIISVPNNNRHQICSLLVDKFKDISIYPWKGKKDIIDLSINSVDKWVNVNRLAKMLGISNENIVSVGDGSNDYSLIKNSGTGIAMKNGNTELKKVANYVSEFTNDEDGVFRFFNGNNEVLSFNVNFNQLSNSIDNITKNDEEFYGKNSPYTR